MTTSLGARIVAACAADGEFRLAARYWTGTLRLDVGAEPLELVLDDGQIVEARVPEGPPPDGPGHISFSAPAELWDQLLAPVPPPYLNDVVPAAAFGLVRSGDTETFWQYYAAVRRVVELLRADRNGSR